MTLLHQAAKEAPTLDRINAAWHAVGADLAGLSWDKFVEALSSLSAALADKEGEPVAWMRRGTKPEHGVLHNFTLSDKWIKDEPNWIPLFTSPPGAPAPVKLWLWRNFVDGRPEYWAFDNPWPRNVDNADPQTLGEPCGYAIFKPSRDGSAGRTEEQALVGIAGAMLHPRSDATEEQRQWAERTRVAYVPGPRSMPPASPTAPKEMPNG